MYGIIPGIVKAATVVEKLFTNSLGLHYNVGFVVYLVLLLGSIDIRNLPYPVREKKCALEYSTDLHHGYYHRLLFLCNDHDPVPGCTSHERKPAAKMYLPCSPT